MIVNLKRILHTKFTLIVVIERVMTGVKRKEVKYRLAGKGGTLKVLYLHTQLRLPSAKYNTISPGTRRFPQELENISRGWAP